MPANCTGKLQPLDLSVNKPLKEETKQHSQARYAEQFQKQITSGTVIPDVKIDTHTSILKPKSWLIGALDSLSQKPEIEKGWVLWFQHVKDRFVLPTFRSEYSDLLQGEDVEKPSLKPEIVINGFRKAGIVDALEADGQ